MIHPHTEVRFVNPAMGYGVFATRDIPRGTIVHVRDPQGLSPAGRSVPETRAVMDGSGVRLLGRDGGRYVNHRCDPNTLATAYGLDIAIRHIGAGQELSTDYGLFGLDRVIPLACGCTRCRGLLRPDDLEVHHARWDERIAAALLLAPDVHQPLMWHLDDADRKRLRTFLCGETTYDSVLTLRAAHRLPPVPVVPPDTPQPPLPGING